MIDSKQRSEPEYVGPMGPNTNITSNKAIQLNNETETETKVIS